jgi:hypothetical protein
MIDHELTIEEWEALVRKGTKNLSEEDIKGIALLCSDAACARANTSVWHNTALYFGTECPCAKCNPN